jgi:hypothetical protein
MGNVRFTDPGTKRGGQHNLRGLRRDASIVTPFGDRDETRRSPRSARRASVRQRAVINARGNKGYQMRQSGQNATTSGRDGLADPASSPSTQNRRIFEAPLAHFKRIIGDYRDFPFMSKLCGAPKSCNFTRSAARNARSYHDFVAKFFNSEFLQSAIRSGN